jgi:hypothetical protein
MESLGQFAWSDAVGLPQDLQDEVLADPYSSLLMVWSAPVLISFEACVKSSHLSLDSVCPLDANYWRCRRLSLGTVLAVPQVRVAARWMSCSRAPSIEM